MVTHTHTHAQMLTHVCTKVHGCFHRVAHTREDCTQREELMNKPMHTCGTATCHVNLCACSRKEGLVGALHCIPCHFIKCVPMGTHSPGDPQVKNIHQCVKCTPELPHLLLCCFKLTSKVHQFHASPEDPPSITCTHRYDYLHTDSLIVCWPCNSPQPHKNTKVYVHWPNDDGRCG